MNSSLENYDNDIINVFDMMTKRLSDIEDKLDSINNSIISIKKHNIYLERSKSSIDGNVFGWDFNINYYDNNENWAKAEAIVFSIDYGFPINFSEDFKNNKYDDILKRKLIDVDMIKSLNLNDDDIDNYKYKNNILPDIVFMHMFNEKLEEYDLRISYMINSEVILETKSHKHFYIDEFISPFIKVCQAFDFKANDGDLEVYKIYKNNKVALYMINDAKEDAKKLWNKYDIYEKNRITKHLKDNTYFKDYHFNFDDYTAKLK